VLFALLILEFYSKYFYPQQPYGKSIDILEDCIFFLNIWGEAVTIIEISGISDLKIINLVSGGWNTDKTKKVAYFPLWKTDDENFYTQAFFNGSIYQDNTS
jgi:hypothetical protein